MNPTNLWSRYNPSKS
uniref:Uncharacterized protein n=1 Tax=Rhizophora mucronata TaxID=61149 RepID=A0A2P2PF75_RHIMU